MDNLTPLSVPQRRGRIVIGLEKQDDTMKGGGRAITGESRDKLILRDLPQICQGNMIVVSATQVSCILSNVRVCTKNGYVPQAMDLTQIP